MEKKYWKVTEKGRVITCPTCNERMEFCYPDGTEVRYLPFCPFCGQAMMQNLHVEMGVKIRIKKMKDEPQYTGREGIVKFIDDEGQIHGTWGGCALIPAYDEYEIIE